MADIEKKLLRLFSGKSDEFKEWKNNFISSMVIKNLDWVLEESLANVKFEKGTEEVIERGKRKVAAYLKTCLDHDLCTEVFEGGEHNGHLAWNTLIKKFDGKDIIKAAKLKADLHRVKFKNIDQYLAEIKDLAKCIASAEGEPKIDNEILIGAILAGLPQSYDGFVAENSRSDLKTIKEKLHTQSELAKIKEDSDDTAINFHTRHSNRGGYRRGSGRGNYRVFLVAGEIIGHLL